MRYAGVMRRWLWGLAFVLGCGSEEASRVADGAACTDDEACKSGDCKGGVCAGSSCEGAGEGCEAGWSCDRCDSITGCTDYCRQLCSGCAAGYVCGSDAYCVYAPVVDAGGPYVTGAGIALELSAIMTPMADPDVEWLWSGEGIDGTLTGQTVSHAFAPGGPYDITVIARDVDGPFAADMTQVSVVQ